MLDLKKVAALAGKAAEAASKTTESFQIDNVVLPRLYAEIGKWVVQHKKLPPDLSQRREEILSLLAQQSEAPPSTSSQGKSSIAEKAKQLASQAGQAAVSAALAAKIRSAYVTLGEYAWSKYGEKVLPEPIAEELKAALARRQALGNPSGKSVATDSRPQAASTPQAAKSPSRVRRSSGGRFRAVLAAVSVATLVAVGVGGWSLFSGLRTPAGRPRAVGAGSKPKVAAVSKSPVAGQKQPASFLSDRPDDSLSLMFPQVVPQLGRPGGSSRNVVLRDGNLLTVIDSGNIEVECVVRTSAGDELARRAVPGELVASSGLNPLVACGKGAALAVKRGQRYSCVVLGGDGGILWETEPLSEVYALAALGDGGILVAANLVKAPDAPFGALYRWDSTGKRAWGHEGGGPFLGKIGDARLEVYELTRDGLMVAADGVVAVTVNGSGPVPSPRVAVSTNAEGQTLAFIPRLPGRLESGEKRKFPMLRGVLRDGRIVAQDPYDPDTVVVYGAEGKELVRTRLGVCMQARSCRDSDDAFLALAAGADTRLVRLRPDGSEAWQVSLQKAIPKVSGDDLHAFLSETLLELPKGGLLWTCRNYAIVVDRDGKVVACGRARDMGAEAGLAPRGKVLWPSVEGPTLVGDLATWPAS